MAKGWAPTIAGLALVAVSCGTTTSNTAPTTAMKAGPAPEAAAAPTSNPAKATPTTPLPQGRVVTWENVTFVIPETWKDFGQRGNFAAGPRIYDQKGYAMGYLNAVSGFEGTLDDLAPRVCLRRADGVGPQKPSAVKVVETGFAPVGARTAQFQRWVATCASGPEEHRAWVLPISRIAIYEVCHDANTVTVASSAVVADRAEPAPAAKPYPNELPGSCRTDLRDSVTGSGEGGHVP